MHAYLYYVTKVHDGNRLRYSIVLLFNRVKSSKFIKVFSTTYTLTEFLLVYYISIAHVIKTFNNVFYG